MILEFLLILEGIWLIGACGIIVLWLIADSRTKKRALMMSAMDYSIRKLFIIREKFIAITSYRKRNSSWKSEIGLQLKLGGWAGLKLNLYAWGTFPRKEM